MENNVLLTIQYLIMQMESNCLYNNQLCSLQYLSDVSHIPLALKEIACRLFLSGVEHSRLLHGEQSINMQSRNQVHIHPVRDSAVIIDLGCDTLKANMEKCGIN